MTVEILESKLKTLREEYQRGTAILQDTQARVLRIEGAIIKLDEILRELNSAVSDVTVATDGKFEKTVS